MIYNFICTKIAAQILFCLLQDSDMYAKESISARPISHYLVSIIWMNRIVSWSIISLILCHPFLAINFMCIYLNISAIPNMHEEGALKNMGKLDKKTYGLYLYYPYKIELSN